MAQHPKIRFAKHAREKFEFITHYGFTIDEAKIVEAVQNPTCLEEKNAQYFAIRAIDAKYALRVVYEKRKRLFSCHDILSCEARAVWRIRSGMMRRPMSSPW